MQTALLVFLNCPSTRFVALSQSGIEQFAKVQYSSRIISSPALACNCTMRWYTMRWSGATCDAAPGSTLGHLEWAKGTADCRGQP